MNIWLLSIIVHLQCEYDCCVSFELPIDGYNSHIYQVDYVLTIHPSYWDWYDWVEIAKYSCPWNQNTLVVRVESCGNVRL